MQSSKPSQLLPNLTGIFKYYCLPLQIDKSLQKITLPEPFTSFQLKILLTYLISSVLKLVIPFSLQYLYLNVNPNNITQPTIKFIIIVILNYYFQLKAQNVMQQHKLKIKKILCQRIARNTLRKPYQQFDNKKQQKNSWNKISNNINIFINNYYASYITITFQTLKAIFIVGYLFYKISWITFIGLFFGGCITQFLSFISKRILNANFARLKSIQLKTKILTEYFSRIVDYQMSWLDGFIGDRVKKYQDDIQINLKKIKMLDAWFIGFWQFTQICISSVMLCLYYFYYAPKQNQTQSKTQKLQPATIIYLFQMLTFPMNAISWNIAGLSNAQRAINQLAESQRSAEVQIKKQKAIQKYDYGIQTIQIERALKLGKIYSLTSQDANIFKKLALSLSSKSKQTGYAQQNGFMLHTVIQSLYLSPSQYLQPNDIKTNIQKLTNMLKLTQCQQIPLQNIVSTFSGGQKMRISLARAFLLGKYIIIDSDLTSLDKNTRRKVFKNIREYVNNNQDNVVIIKGKKQDQDIKNYVNQFIKVQSKFSRVYFQSNKKIQQSINPQKQQQKTKIKQKILLQINKLQNQKLLHNCLNIQNNHQPLSNIHKSRQIPKKMQRKLFISFSTFKFYFQNKLYHFLFIISLTAMYSVGNYYYYYVNVKKIQDNYVYVSNILYLTVIYVIFIIGRSYFFAVANLKQQQRICYFTNNIVLYNHINFYDKYQIIQNNPQQQQPQTSVPQPHSQQINKKLQKKLNTQKLVYISTSDQNILNNIFPFSTNRLWNYIAQVIGSLIMVFIQVPIMIIFTFIFIAIIKKIQKQYRTASQQFIHKSKQNQIHLMKSINYIESGALYLRIYNKANKFIHIYNQELDKVITNDNKQLNLSIWIQSNYRFNMIAFLIFSVFLFSFDFSSWFGEYFGNSSSNNQSAKMSVMVRYILLLADYAFYFTRKFSQCRGQAISIQRIRRIMQNSNAIKGSFQRKQRSNHKIEGLIKALKQDQITINKQYINLCNFNYQYDKKGSAVLQNINIKIKNCDKIILKGKTGAGKTTLFKILMGLYPQTYFCQKNMHLMAFSSQHPLKMGQSSILQKLDPYKIMQHVPIYIKNKVMQKIAKILQKAQKNIPISYEQQVLINNLRAYLYGFKGLTIYDEPQLVIEQNNTYIVVTHHGKFNYTTQWKLQKGRIFQIHQKQNM